MTGKILPNCKARYLEFIRDTIKPLALAILLIFFVLNSDTVRADVYDTILYLSSKLIPTLFPFAVITQLILRENLKIPFSGFLCKLLGIPRNLITPLILGIICGFPIGAILVRDLYKQGAVEKKEAERIIILSSQPSIAFLLFISKQTEDIFHQGNLLPASLLVILCFLIFSKRKDSKFGISNVISRQSIPLTSCITASGEAMISLSFFVTAFCAVASVIKSTLKNPNIIALILPFLEISTATSYLSSGIISDNLKLFLIPFSVGFSGLSVYMQIKNILSDTDLGIKKYIPVKLLQGLIFGVLIYIIYT